MFRWLGTALLACALLAACGSDNNQADEPVGRTDDATVTSTLAKISLSSPAFAEGESIPTRYSCEGDNASPALSWSGVPEDAKSLLVEMEDPDAPRGTFRHWMLYDLPPETVSLAEDVGVVQRPTAGGVHGSNDYPRSGYSGPCPPRGETHRYVFTIYALNKVVDTPPGLPARYLGEVIDGHVLAQGTLTGTFGR